MSVDGADGDKSVRLDAGGSLVEQRTPVPSMRIVRTTREQTEQVGAYTYSDSELLIFPVDAEMQSINKLQTLRVHLKWKETLLDEFNLESVGQSIEAITTVDNAYTATVRLSDSTSALAETPFPISVPGMYRWLAETDFIQPQNERIAAQAGQIVEGAATVQEAVRRISQWIHTHVEQKMIAEKLSGSQVLERCQGKCTEFANLFASLAGSAGIPTRVALELRRFPTAAGSSWGGHLCNDRRV